MTQHDALILFAALDENVRLGSAAFRSTLLQAKATAARSPKVLEEDTTARVAHFLLAAQYEARFNWLVWHPNSRLTPSQRNTALGSGGLSARWKFLLKLALRDRLGRREPSRELTLEQIPSHLPREDRARYHDLISVARSHLDPLIDMRNSLAHGEWKTALTRKADGFNQARTGQLEGMSLFKVTILANLLDHYWKCYFDALVTEQAFERDFPIHHRRMMHAAVRLEHSDEDRWLLNLRRRFRDGRASGRGLTDPPQPTALLIHNFRRGATGT